MWSSKHIRFLHFPLHFKYRFIQHKHCVMFRRQLQPAFTTPKKTDAHSVSSQTFQLFRLLFWRGWLTTRPRDSSCKGDLAERPLARISVTLFFCSPIGSDAHTLLVRPWKVRVVLISWPILLLLQPADYFTFCLESLRRRYVCSNILKRTRASTHVREHAHTRTKSYLHKIWSQRSHVNSASPAPI